MALSKSIVRAQDVMVCQLCKSDPRLKWKCLECNLLMCITCTEKIHPKFKNAKDHTILDIKQLGQIDIHMVCQLCEVDKILKWKCIDCGLLMCIKCTEKIHSKFKNAKDHTILDIKQLEQIESQKEIDINNVQCKTHAGLTCCLFCCPCKILVCVECVANGHAGHKLQEIKNVSNVDIEHVMKSLQSVCLAHATKLKLNVRRQFVTELSHCHIMNTGHDGSLWILDSPPLPLVSVLQNVVLQDQNLHTLLTIDTIGIWDFRILSTGDILVADRTSTLKTICRGTGKVTSSKFHAKSLFIIAVYVTDDDKVLVAARSTEAAFPVSGRRVVLMMDNEGKKESEWEYDKNNKKIFTCPHKMSCSHQGTIFVVDRFSLDLDGRIVVLNRNGGLVNTYEGHPDYNNDNNPFLPQCVVTTPSDNIIVCDDDINILHYLDYSGSCLSIVDTTAIGIDRPYSLTFMNHDTMYIGCTSNYDSADKEAKIYELQFSES